MERYRDKMRDFVQKLWTNPAIMNTPIQKKEAQILSFIRENQRNLQEAFHRPDFFPGLDWDSAVRLLITELTETTQQALRPRLDEVIDRAIHPAVRSYFQSHGGFEIETSRFRDFILDAMRQKQLRDQYMATLDAISYKLYDRYAAAAMTRHKFIYNELVRRDRVSIDATYMAEYLKLASLFRPLFYLKLREGPVENLSLAGVAKDPRTARSVLIGLQELLEREIGRVPEGLLKPGLDSNLSSLDFPDISGAARMIQILVMRGVEYNPDLKQDRGAESPDKSWFNINRRTAKNYGYDGKFLEELYLIAGEEGW
jgi:hypothetical protein